MRDFISLVIKSAKVAVSTIKNSSLRAKQGMFAVVALIAIMASLSFSGTRIAYKVSYKGNVIATVGSKKQFDDALLLVSGRVSGDDVFAVVDKPRFSATVVLGKDIDNTNQLADAIISNTDAIAEASTITVDGVVIARGEKNMVERVLNERLNGFNIDGAECSSRFEKEISITNDYFVLDSLDNEEKVKNAVNTLNVITEAKKVTDVIVPYGSVTQNTNEKVVGQTEVAVVGVSGIDRLTQEIVLLNGQEKSNVTVNTETIIAPVDELILKGTAKNESAAQLNQQAHSYGFIFPLPSGTWRISSYYGDGRNHKGVDICAKGGTSIYAVQSGKVIYSGWRGDYGYCVIVEHSSGMRTLYAHAKKLCCVAGDTVSQGDVIALVGTTGQSTGNHLHFEVIVNGVRVNPAPYINLN